MLLGSNRGPVAEGGALRILQCGTEVPTRLLPANPRAGNLKLTIARYALHIMPLALHLTLHGVRLKSYQQVGGISPKGFYNN